MHNKENILMIFNSWQGSASHDFQISGKSSCGFSLKELTGWNGRQQKE